MPLVAVPLPASVAVPALAASAQADETKLTPAEQVQLDRNLKLGALLYRYDQSAWHVTDAALAALPEDTKGRIRGYVTTPAPEGLRTTFFSEDGSSYFALFSAVWTGSQIVGIEQYAAGEQRRLTGDELQLVQARKIGLEEAGSLRTCSEASPNVIVVPESTDRTLIHVYVLTPQTEDGIYPFGGHNRIDVRDHHIVSKRVFTNGCISLSNKGTATEKSVAMAITHVLDTIPTEIHVFEMLAANEPVVVITSRNTYVLSAPGGQPRFDLVHRTK